MWSGRVVAHHHLCRKAAAAYGDRKSDPLEEVLRHLLAVGPFLTRRPCIWAAVRLHALSCEIPTFAGNQRLSGPPLSCPHMGAHYIAYPRHSIFTAWSAYQGAPPTPGRAEANTSAISRDADGAAPATATSGADAAGRLPLGSSNRTAGTGTPIRPPTLPT